MVESAKISQKKILGYCFVLAGFFLLIEFAEVWNTSITVSEATLLTGWAFGVAAGLMTFAFISFIKEPASARKIALYLLLANLVTSIAAILLYGLLAPATDFQNLLFVGLSVSLTFYIIALILMVPIGQILGSDRVARIEKMIGEARTEKIKLATTRISKIWVQFSQNRAGMFAFYILVFIFIIAIIGPFIAPEDPLQSKASEFPIPQPPSERYWFGTDFQDKDVWSQFLYGAKTSLVVGILAGFISLVIGTAIGLVAGYFGKAWDEVLMRLTDFFLVIPWFPLMIVLVAILGRSLLIVIIVIGIVSWSPTARVVRAAVLSIKEKMYIERSRALGAGNMHIIRRHIFPNVFPLIVATSILLIAEAIFSEAFLSFFGLGDPYVVSWGWMLERAHEGSAMLNLWWWWILPPSIGIILLIMSFYLVGDTLDEVLNPRLKRR